jgi:four helix bundle protein
MSYGLFTIYYSFNFITLAQTSSMREFKRLQVWQLSHALTLTIYSVTATFPTSEVFGLVSQMRRAASSIPTNIAEGCGRKSATELSRFFQIAHGSCAELEYLLLLSKDLRYINDHDFEKHSRSATTISRMLYNYMKRLC